MLLSTTMKKIPRHLGIIMDGNRRWAKSKGLLSFRGHTEGVETLKKIITHCQKRGIKILTVFAFSTENWQRSSQEVNFLMVLFKKAVDRNLQNLIRDGIKVSFIGQKERLPSRVMNALIKAEESTKNNKGLILNIALSYGGRTEIVSAVQAIIKKKIPAEKITEATIAENLWAPDVDFLIRTGKEQRISNFLIWQAAYAELYFSEKYWPDFTEDDLDKALDEFDLRDRRHGK